MQNNENPQGVPSTRTGDQSSYLAKNAQDAPQLGPAVVDPIDQVKCNKFVLSGGKYLLFPDNDAPELPTTELDDVSELMDPREITRGPIRYDPEVTNNGVSFEITGTIMEGHGMQPICWQCGSQIVSLNVSTISGHKILSCKYCYTAVGAV